MASCPLRNNWSGPPESIIISSGTGPLFVQEARVNGRQRRCGDPIERAELLLSEILHTLQGDTTKVKFTEMFARAFATRGSIQPARRTFRKTSLHYAIPQRATIATGTTRILAPPPTVESPGSPFARPSKATKKKHAFVPRKAAVKLTDKAREFFKTLLDNPPRKDIVGVMLNYGQPQSGEPRMVFSFQFVTADEIDWDQDEGVSLELVKEVDRNGNMVEVPKPPSDSQFDGLPKLYVHHNAFLKVLGATVDVDTEAVSPVLYDREGNIMDPNA